MGVQAGGHCTFTLQFAAIAPGLAKCTHMQIADLLTPERVQVLPGIKSKKKLLELMAEHLARDLGVNAREIYESIYEREQQGNTSLGNGVAIPHGKLQDAPDDMPLTGVLVKLQQPLDFNAPDQSEVDIVLAMVVPASTCCDQHQQDLQQLAEQLHNPNLQQRIRQIDNAPALYDLLAAWAPEDQQDNP